MNSTQLNSNFSRVQLLVSNVRSYWTKLNWVWNGRSVALHELVSSVQSEQTGSFFYFTKSAKRLKFSFLSMLFCNCLMTEVAVYALQTAKEVPVCDAHTHTRTKWSSSTRPTVAGPYFAYPQRDGDAQSIGSLVTYRDRLPAWRRPSVQLLTELGVY